MIPHFLNQATLLTMHKWGLTTQLKNKCGVMLSNFIASLPFAWLSLCLDQYNMAHSLIPQSQIVTQHGVQGCDLTSFLAQLHSWAIHADQPLFILKCDQQKGFDFLAPEGFYDAVATYGLPPEISQLDQSFQMDVQCQIHMAYGDTDVLLINGVTCQGRPLSPFKSALTMSLGHCWLSDSFGIMVQSLLAHKGEPHTPLDDIMVKVAMVEATDDSLLFADSIIKLWEMCISMEWFQFAYGWMTAWDKSEVSIINSDSYISPSIQMPSIDTGNPLS